MSEENFILEYTNKHYPEENALIARSLVNYYYLKNKEGKTEAEEFFLNEIYECVLELFRILAGKLDEEIGFGQNSIYTSLKAIHIKT
jgi:hypothetical protein